MSAVTVSLQFSADDMQAFKQLAKVMPKAAAAAQRRAINKTLGWLATHMARDVSKQERIAVRARPVSQWRGGATRAPFTNACMATRRTSGFAPPANISTRMTIPAA